MEIEENNFDLHTTSKYQPSDNEDHQRDGNQTSQIQSGQENLPIITSLNIFESLLPGHVNRKKKKKCRSQEQQSQCNKFRDGKSLALRRVNYSVIPMTIASNKELQIFADLILTTDGAFRLTTDQFHLSFGYTSGTCLRVVELKNMNVVNIEYSLPQSATSQPNTPHEYIELLRQSNNKLHRDISNQLNLLLEMMNEFKLHQQQFKKTISIQQKPNKGLELHAFKQRCFEYLQKVYIPCNTDTMFVYIIGNVEEYKEINTAYQGYSKSYLELIGLDSSALASLVLRGKRIDLMQGADMISMLSLQMLKKRQRCCENWTEFESDITTFDGFNLKIKATSHLVNLSTAISPDEEDCLFYMTIAEIDVDLKSLEGLIIYRQSSTSGQEMNYDDYLKRELSLMFEDVEYSVHSQEFFDKFYDPNIEKMRAMRQEIMEETTEKEIKRCQFKEIVNRLEDHTINLDEAALASQNLASMKLTSSTSASTSCTNFPMDTTQLSRQSHSRSNSSCISSE